MKKSLIGIFGALLASQVFAGGIDAKTNLNAGYIRNPSRNTESERPEAALYNIAGTAFMADGLYLEAGNQFIFKTYSHEVAGTEYKDEKPVFLFPNAEIVYKHGKLGFFGTFQVAAGGGSLEYKDGTALLGATTPVDIYSVTFGQNLGASFAINDKVSLSGAVRLLESNQSMEAKNPLYGKLGYEASGFGVGGIFGVNWRPVENLDLAFQYKPVTKMECEIDSTKGPAAVIATFGIVDGKKYDADLSPEFNFGAGYKIDNLYLSSSFNYYFNGQADMGSALSDTNADYDDSWEIYGGADYKINEKFLVSGGIGYSKQGYNDDYNNVFSPVLDCVSFGLGGEITPVKALTVAFGGMYAKYLEEEYNSLTLNKSIIMLGLSATYKFGL
ncbi:MAG: outer membrane protein transport protein [Treponema sp.]|nr:outer membrane protein transport protein [Treponema sp.]